MKHVVSISLGSSSRDAVAQENFNGEIVHIERRGTDGDKAKAKRLFESYDGKVDAIGLGGTDLYIFAGGRRYTFRESARLIGTVRQTPVLDGSGLKNSLERIVIANLEKKGIINFSGKKVLLVCGVDRFGMAEALTAAGARVTFGDLIFGLGLEIPVYSLKVLSWIARVVAPIITKMPVSWFYPVGTEQTKRLERYPKYFAENEIIAGDFHFIRKYMPEQMSGKIIITNTVTQRDRELLEKAGVACLVTTTPNFKGRSFGTNVLEAALVSLAGCHEALTANEYEKMLEKYDIQPGIEYFSVKG
ncbi:MAG: quinate 5-dehydrogenase [Negativicutes bacterium]|nr:quinate 5-dehydrogenase [Negativicutes bacterium]